LNPDDSLMIHALASSEANLQAFFAGMSQGVVFQRGNGTLIDCNPAAEKILGLTREMLLGRSSVDPRWRAVHADGSTYPGEDHPAMVTLRTGQAIRNAVMGVHDPARGLRWISINTYPVVAPEQKLPSSVVTTFEDMTDQRAMDAKLKAASAEILDLYDHTPCAFHSLDAQGKFLRINATGLQWLGCSVDEAIGHLGPRDFFTDEGRAQFAMHYPKLLEHGHLENLEFDLVGRHGETRRVSVNATVATDEHGSFLMTRTVMFDITQLAQARLQLNTLATEQRALLDNDLIGMVKLRNRRAIWINRGLCRIYGYSHDELMGAPSSLLYLDKAAYQDFGEKAYAVLRTGKNYRTQIQMRRKDGRLIWIDLSGSTTGPDSDESIWTFVDITAMKQAQAQMEHLAFHDALTGLPNRRLLGDRLAQALAQARRSNTVLALCYLDLDGFKPVNDRLGHAAGDAVLREVASRLIAVLRGNDSAARLGGDEFVLILTQMALVTEIEATLKRVMLEIERPIQATASEAVHVSASVGVALCPHNANQPDQLMQLADQAMYQAKSLGRRRIQFCESTAADTSQVSSLT
jgi:diguanylate cyclase (GGDEF)-like protein/PAS domain S-box-containing protein